MLQLEINPSFLKPCVFELDIEQERFSFTIKSFMQRNERSWEFEIDVNEAALKIYELAKKIIQDKKIDNRIILDGVSLICQINENGIQYSHTFKCPEKDTKELLLVESFLAFGKQMIADQEFVNYTELLEGYFANYKPFKYFDELPYRLKIYGSLSVYEKPCLSEAFQKMELMDVAIIDMTNFEGMGTVLYECFEPLKNKTGFNFWANKPAVKHLSAMGFSLDRIIEKE